MEHCNTIFYQLLQIFPRHEFDKLASKYHVGQRSRSFNRWSQFGALFMGQLTGRRSLRDIVANMAVHGKKFYHLGFANISRTTLARTNEKQPALMYDALFNTMLRQCQCLAPGNRFKIKHLYLLDLFRKEPLYPFSKICVTVVIRMIRTSFSLRWLSKPEKELFEQKNNKQ